MQGLHRFIQKETTRNFMKLFSGTMVAQGISFALAPVLSRLYTPDDFGLVALYLSILSVLSVISTAKYEQAIMLPRKDTDAIRMVWLVLAISLVVTVITAIAVTLFNRDLARLSGNPAIAPWLYFLPLSLLLHGIFQSATYYANRHKQFGLMASGTVVQYSVLNAVRLIAGWIKTAFSGLIAGQIAGQVVSAVYIWFGIYKPIKKAGIPAGDTTMKLLARKYSGYPKYNMPLNFTNNLSGSLPVFMLTWGFSPAVAGLYAFGYTFVFRPAGLFSQTTLQVLSQKIISDHHQDKAVYPGLKKLAGRLLLMAAIPGILLALFAPALFAFAFSEEYRMAGIFMQYLSPYMMMVFIASPLAFIPELFFRQKKAMVIDMIYLALRFIALGLGIHFQSIILAMALFSLTGTVVVTYNLFWYLSLARHADRKLAGSHSPGNTAPGANGL